MKQLLRLLPIIVITFFAMHYRESIAKALLDYRNATQYPESSHEVQLNTAHFLSIAPSPSPTKTPKKQVAEQTKSAEEWGVAKKVGEGTYTIRVGNDAEMGSAQDVFNALNAYRAANGIGPLNWDDNLARYAQSRAEYMQSIQTTDQHAGFNHFLEAEDGFNKMGYYQLGENSYYGGKLSGTHVIEWVFAKSPGHDANQKNTEWSHVGVGVTDSTVNLNFGGRKM
jgi:uncharacterized protein YkwD